jgi:hypothetical protein
MRTPREIILIVHGLGCAVWAHHLGDTSWNIYAYLGATALFAARFFAGRVLYLSMLIGALALQLSCVLHPRIDLVERAPVLLQILALMFLLCGKELVRIFDDEGRGIGPIRNFWRELSVGQRRHVAWGIHLVGATGGLLHHMSPRAATATWVYVAIAATFAVGFLYVWGRAIAAPAAVVVGGAIAWKLAPWVEPAVTLLRGKPLAHPVAREVWHAPHYVPGAFLLAAAAAIIAIPWTVRWARLALR